jgi:hypothetical protein
MRLVAGIVAVAIAACGGPRFDAAASAACEGIAAGMPRSVVATAFVTTLGRIRAGGYDVEQPDPWHGQDDGVAATICAIDTPSLGGAEAPTRLVIALTDASTGSKIIDLGAADALPLPTP